MADHKYWYGETGDILMDFDESRVRAKLDATKAALEGFKLTVEKMKERVAYLKTLEMGTAVIISNYGKGKSMQYLVTPHKYPLKDKNFRFNEDGYAVVKTPAGEIEATLPFGESQHCSDYASAKEWAKYMAKETGGIIVREKPKKAVKE